MILARLVSWASVALAFLFVTAVTVLADAGGVSQVVAQP